MESEAAVSTYQWLCLLGVPTILISALLGMIKHLANQIKHDRADTAATKLGVQALLRAQMIADYNKWHDRGYAPIYARQNFENCWKQYHVLGANGVMDDIHHKFLQLPAEK